MYTLLNIFFYITFFAFSFGQLGRISFLQQRVNGYWYEVSLGICMLIFLLRYGVKPIVRYFKPMAMLLIFAAYMTLSTGISLFYYSSFDNMVAVLYLVRLLMYIVYFVYAAYHMAESPPIKKLFVNGFWNILFIAIVTGVLQYFFFPDLAKLYNEGWDPHLYRLFGLFFDPSVAGAVFGMLFLFVLMSQHKMTENIWMKALLIAILFVLILFTFSRGTYIGLFAALFILALRKKALYLLAGFAGIFTMGLLLLPKPMGEGVNLLRTSTIDARAVDYREGIDVWKNTNPAIGIGYDHIRAVKKTAAELSANGTTYSHAGSAFHSSFLTILVTGGLIGFLLFVMGLVELAQINAYSLYAVIFLSVMSLFDNILLHPFVLFLLFSTLALQVSYPSDNSPSES